MPSHIISLNAPDSLRGGRGGCNFVLFLFCFVKKVLKTETLSQVAKNVVQKVVLLAKRFGILLGL